MKKNVFQQPRAEAKDTWTMPRREKGRTKSKDMTVAEPEMVYGQGRAMQGGLMLYIVPKKDRSFLEDMAKVRGWKSLEKDMFDQILGKGRKAKTNKETSHHEPNACTVRAMKDALAGRVFRAKSPQDLIQQILG